MEDGTAIYPEEVTQEEPVEEIEEETSFNIEGTASSVAENNRNTTPVLYGKVATLLNVRAGTSLDEKKVGLLKKGRLIEILEERGEGWYRISFDVSCGYAYVNNANGAYIRTIVLIYSRSGGYDQENC